MKMYDNDDDDDDDIPPFPDDDFNPFDPNRPIPMNVTTGDIHWDNGERDNHGGKWGYNPIMAAYCAYIPIGIALLANTTCTESV